MARFKTDDPFISTTDDPCEHMMCVCSVSEARLAEGMRHTVRPAAHI